MSKVGNKKFIYFNNLNFAFTIEVLILYYNNIH